MTDFIPSALHTASGLVEKAAIITDFVLDDLPKNIAFVARRCVVLHWFNHDIVEAMLREAPSGEDGAGEVYEQLSSLPFIETLPWGLAFQDLTREGLVTHYAATQPEILKDGARVAAAVYEVHKDNRKILAEAFFCHIISGNQEAAIALFGRLLSEAYDLADWHYLDAIRYFQEEAEQLPFVLCLPSPAQQSLQDIFPAFQGFVSAVRALKPVLQLVKWSGSVQTSHQERNDLAQTDEIESTEPSLPFLSDGRALAHPTGYVPFWDDQTMGSSLAHLQYTKAFRSLKQQYHHMAKLLSYVAVSVAIIAGITGAILAVRPTQAAPPAISITSTGGAAPGANISVHGANFTKGGTVNFTVNNRPVLATDIHQFTENSTLQAGEVSLSTTLSGSNQQEQIVNIVPTVQNDGTFDALLTIPTDLLPDSNNQYIIRATEPSSEQTIATILIAQITPTAITTPVPDATPGSKPIKVPPVAPGVTPVPTLFPASTPTP